jgi:hypothetical protein
MKPSFCRSERAAGCVVMSRSSNEICFCERYSFTLVQNRECADRHQRIHHVGVSFSPQPSVHSAH